MNSSELRNHAMPAFAEIILGSPRARCARFGICETRLLDFESWNNFRPKSARSAKALLSAGKPGELALVFPTAQMLPLTLDYFFGSGFFKVDVPTPLSPALLGALNLESFVVKKGSYPCGIAPQAHPSVALMLTVTHDLNSTNDPWEIEMLEYMGEGA